MKVDDLFKEYSEGRRDFRGVCLQGQDMFVAALQHRIPDILSYDIATLILKNDPVANAPMDGAILVDTLLDNASLVDADLTKAIMNRATLRSADVRFATLAGADLAGADLQYADLRGADLSGVNFESANLADAKLDHCVARKARLDGAVLNCVTGIGADFSYGSLLNTTMRDAQFSGARFHKAEISDSILDRASFRSGYFDNAIVNRVSAIQADFSYINGMRLSAINSDFSQAKFNFANLSYANLVDSILSRADLSEANLLSAILDRGILDHASLVGAKIRRTSLQSTSLLWAIIGGTLFSGVDLTSFVGTNIAHHAPSSIDYLSVSITLSKTPSFPFEINPVPRLKSFLEESGMPSIVVVYFIDSIRTLQPDQLFNLMHSTFISYGHPDEEFARKLNDDLKNHGVVTFFFPNHAQFGEKLHSTMRRVDDYDRIILICSAQSLNRVGLQYELEKTIEREARNGGASYLIPITLDSYLYDDWKPMRPDLKQEILNRVVADFSKPDNYENQFARLLYILRKELPTPEMIY